MDSGEWQNATKVKLPFEIDPGDSTPAKVDTFAYIMEDGEYFYVAFKAYDPNPEIIVANIRDRDNIFGDDFVGVVVDPFNDARIRFDFFVNPLGSQGDLTQDDVQNIEDPTWNAVWNNAGQLNDDGFTVEIAVPYRSIRYTANLDIQTWGIEFVRNYPRNVSRLMIDAPSDRKLECTLCQYNKVTGMPSLQSAGVDFDIVPSLTYTDSETRAIGGDWQELDNESELGADLRWAMTENWIVNAAITPDFSQVEADVPQLDINTTFSLFFPETRSFFLDGAEYFNTANQLMHTRNIADPDYGVKLTGQTDNFSLGVIASRDEKTSFLLPSSQGASIAVENDSSDVLIARGQYDYVAGNNCGFLLTNRSADDYQNTVESVDGKHHFSPTDILSYQVMYSELDTPLSIQNSQIEQSHSDTAYSIEYRHKDENASFKVAHTKFGEDFRADMGFIT
ncbi:hypothetical protein BTN33_12690 [Aeromonas veronii]|nr:hypothetical protein BTN33_12690 [Aeromonas veronii]